jgi:hypothetical protein
VINLKETEIREFFRMIVEVTGESICLADRSHNTPEWLQFRNTANDFRHLTYLEQDFRLATGVLRRPLLPARDEDGKAVVHGFYGLSKQLISNWSNETVFLRKTCKINIT